MALIFRPCVTCSLPGSGMCSQRVLITGFSLPATIGTSTIVHLSPGAAIGKITGVHFAWVGITGSAVAPTLIALLAEQVFGGGQEALGLALSGAGGTLAMIGGLSLLVVSWQLRRRDAGLAYVAAA